MHTPTKMEPADERRQPKQEIPTLEIIVFQAPSFVLDHVFF